MNGKLLKPSGVNWEMYEHDAGDGRNEWDNGSYEKQNEIAAPSTVFAGGRYVRDVYDQVFIDCSL